MKIHIRFEMDGPGQKLPRRNNHAAPAGFVASRYRFCDRASAVVLHARFRTELCNEKIALRKSWWTNAREYLWIFSSPWIRALTKRELREKGDTCCAYG